MRRRSTANQQAAGVSLFPFLAVLLCTMGALIVVLVVIARQAHIQVADAARRANAAAAGSELAAQGEDLEWRISELKQSREDTLKILNARQAELSHIEEHARRLRDQLDELEDARVHFSELASGDAKESEDLKKRLTRLRIDADRTKREIDDLRRKSGGGNGESYAIIPYHGANETHRRPIYMECRGDMIILQPEGIVLGIQDFTVDLGPSNPLVSALRAAKEYHERNQLAGRGEAGRPYPLFLVRPDGVLMWQVGREAISSFGPEFGYELVAQDWKVEFPPAERMLKLAMNQAVEDARIKQQYLASAAPRMVHGGGGTFRAARGGGLVQVDGSPASHGGGRRGRGRPAGIAGRRGGGRSQAGGSSAGGGLADTSSGTNGEGPIHSIDGDDNPYLSALGPGGGNANQPSAGSSAGTGTGRGGSGSNGLSGTGAAAATNPLAGGPDSRGAPGGSGWRGGGNAGGSPFGDPTASALGKGGKARLPGGGGGGPNASGIGSAGGGAAPGPAANQLAMAGGQGRGMYPASTGEMPPGGIGQSGGGPAGNRYGGPGNGPPAALGGGHGSGLGDGQGTLPGGASATGTGGTKNGGSFAGQNGGQKGANGGGGWPTGQTSGSGSPNQASGLLAAGYPPGTPGDTMPARLDRGQRGNATASANGKAGAGTSDLTNSDPNAASSDSGSNAVAGPNGFAGATVVDNGQSSGNTAGATSRTSGAAGNATSGSLSGVDGGGANSGTTSRGTGGNSSTASSAGRSNSFTGNPNNNFSSSQVSSSSSSSSSGQQSPFGGSAGSSMSAPQMGGMPSPNFNFGQRQAQSDEKKRHRQREKNWANPDASTTNVPIERPIRVVCDADHLTLLPEGRGKQAMRVIPFKAQTSASVDELVGAVWDRIDSWGTAGRGMYWRPKLSMEIEPGGQRRYTELQALLADSGFDVHGKPRRRLWGDRRLGKMGN